MVEWGGYFVFWFRLYRKSLEELSFDFGVFRSYFEVFGKLFCGGRVVIV